MKRTAYLYALLMALCACMPQKRLVRLISRYPALAADTTLIMPARIALPHKTAARLLDIPVTVPKITTMAAPPPEKPVNAFFRVLGIITAVAIGLLTVWKFIKIKP